MATGEQYPELAKFSEVQQQISDLIGFIEYLNEKGYHLGRWRSSDIRLDPANLSEAIVESLAGDFVGVDMAKVDAERTKLLKANQEKQS